MLSVPCRLARRGQRSFGALAVTPSKGKVVKFQKEDMSKVVAEVPEFKFYRFDHGLRDYQYREVPMDQNIFPEGTGAVVKSKWVHTELENKLKIVARDRGGDVATIALYVRTGPRFETMEDLGISDCVAGMAWRSTAHLSHLRTLKTLEQLGNAHHADCEVSREHICYKVSVPREYVPLVIPLITGNVLFPRLLRWEVDTMKDDINKKRVEIEASVDRTVSEMFHETAFLNNTYGNKMRVRPRILGDVARPGEDPIGVNAHDIREFMMKWFSPDNMCLVGVNVSSEELSKWAMRSFVDHNEIPPTKRDIAKPEYTGGLGQREADTNFCHLAVGFECDNFVSNATAGAVLNAYLTSGTGSRCSAECDKNQSLISFTSFSNLYSDTGVFGLYAQIEGKDVESALDSMKTIFKEKPTAEGIKRAKAQVKAELIQSLTNPEALAQDAGEQMILTGGVADVSELIAAVDKVTDAEVAGILSKGMAKPPTVIAYGNTTYIRSYDSIKKSLS